MLKYSGYYIIVIGCYNAKALLPREA